MKVWQVTFIDRADDDIETIRTWVEDSLTANQEGEVQILAIMEIK